MTRPNFKSEFLSVAYEVIDRERHDLRPTDIVRLAFENGLFTKNIAGRTPSQTMKAKLSVHVRRFGEQSVFIRTRPGRFYLRHLLDGAQAPYDAPPFTPPPQIDRVLVFPTSILDALGRFQGISGDATRYLGILRAPECTYVDRLEAERREDMKQVLTYVLVRRGDEVLSFKRGTYNRVEEFLRGAHCIGFGGHVTESDLTLFGLSDRGLTSSAARELAEELSMPAPDRTALARRDALKLIGVINDDSSAVGRRHFAFVFSYVVTTDSRWLKPQRGEKSITQLRWVSPSDLDQPFVRFEYWSQLCLSWFFASTPPPLPEYFIRRGRALRPPNVLCVAGPIGSGKSEATRVLHDDFGYVEINSGRVLASLLRLPPVSQTGPPDAREAFQRAAWEFINSASGPERLARALLQNAEIRGGDRLLLDGIRQPSTLAALRRLATRHRVSLLYIHTPTHIALEFYRERADPHVDPIAFFRMREAAVEQQVGELLPLADAVIYNWTGKTTYREAIHQLMSAVGVSPG